MTNLVALVTGASSDLGSAITHGLTKIGAQVIATGRSHEKLVRVAAEHGDKIDIVAADLTTADGRQAVQDFVARRGRLDILVLGSGIYERSADLDSLSRQFAANVDGPYRLTRGVLPLLAEAKGLVVFLNSTQGLAASPGIGEYAATQHAMRALADSLRGEVNSRGVRVTTVFLGRTATARQAEIFAIEGRPYTPELLIQPSDVASIVANLAMLPVTSEVMEIKLRPSIKSY